MSTTNRSAKPIQSLRDLTVDPKNANRGTPRGRDLIEHSLQALGAGRSIVADREGYVIAGNKTLHEARQLEMPVTVVQTQGDALVVVQRTDLELATDDRARRLAIADNRTTEVDLEWDEAQLRALAAEGLNLGEFWSEAELERLF